MSRLDAPLPTQQVAGLGGVIHHRLHLWLQRLVMELNLGLPPVGSIVLSNLSADDISAEFDANGLGNVGGTWDGWQICNGNNGTPDLDDNFARLATDAAGGTLTHNSATGSLTSYELVPLMRVGSMP